MAASGPDDYLRKVSDTLANDGYQLSARMETDGTLQIRITADESACAECLVPKGAMLRLLHAALPPQYQRVELTYPSESDPADGSRRLPG
jgi:hypothetical protein